ncbi:Multistep phosphorelay regulator 1 [Golovinomyces cichoracearum]|uniref:Multistep phosphorelay regulator 1 n=1 Tax=Golovinomyces cichoracearum TaxID=62708 RepID=A0A420IL54_9PEZI|nr:Multistep phosphorelay regulator 1 [Golovinomyces cichoracearum]
MSDTHSLHESEAGVETEADADQGQIPAIFNEWGENVDAATFMQILEMDDDEDEKEFSKSIVLGFFDQAEATFIKMDDALESKDLAALSSLGHFLKGSSATLGLSKVMNSCEKIQHFGQKKDAEGINDEKDEDKCLGWIEETFNKLKKEYDEVVRILKTYYGIKPPSETAPEEDSKA